MVRLHSLKREQSLGGLQIWCLLSVCRALINTDGKISPGLLVESLRGWMPLPECRQGNGNISVVYDETGKALSLLVEYE